MDVLDVFEFARRAEHLSGELSPEHLPNFRSFLADAPVSVRYELTGVPKVMNLPGLHATIHVEAAVPCPDQDSRWSRQERERYARLLESCDKYTLISERYTYTCMAERNSYMIAQSSLLVAVFSGERGGTFNTIREAVSLGRRIVEIEI